MTLILTSSLFCYRTCSNYFYLCRSGSLSKHAERDGRGGRGINFSMRQTCFSERFPRRRRINVCGQATQPGSQPKQPMVQPTKQSINQTIDQQTNLLINQPKLMHQASQVINHWKTSFEKNFFCVGEYAEYGFDQQRLIWYVFRLWDRVFS